uniref:ARAD1D27016p n=1 Tax=Blastobotrys adeninivorans TaxID=409370 RepID=A0A060TGZ2_BLAAD
MPGFKKVGWTKAQSPSQPSSQSPPPTDSTSSERTKHGMTDEEYRKAFEQQQLAYQKPVAAVASRPLDGNSKSHDENKRLTVKRSGGGKKWEDPSLLEWDPKHFRLFVGNLSPEVTDDMLINAFKQYKSMSKAKVVMDRKTQKNKGFGFVAFSDPEDYFQAFKNVNGKYIGNHPVQLKRANTEIKTSAVKNRGHPYKRR